MYHRYQKRNSLDGIRNVIAWLLAILGVAGLIGSLVAYLLIIQAEGSAAASKPVVPTSIPTVVSTIELKNLPSRSTPTAVATTNTCDDLLVLVDKTHALPETYEPSDLVYLADYAIPVNAGSAMGRKIMIDDLQRLFAAITQEGIELVVVSAYRSYAQQAAVYNSYAAQYGAEQANTFSALPGHSQHQLGTTMDFSNAETDYGLTESFENTRAGKWLLANAYKYGFYISYPEGHDHITGYVYEPWHYRYIGVQNAFALHQSGEIMQTYLAQHGPKPHC